MLLGNDLDVCCAISPRVVPVVACLTISSGAVRRVGVATGFGAVGSALARCALECAIWTLSLPPDRSEGICT
jgi:hypothetical protein